MCIIFKCTKYTCICTRTYIHTYIGTSVYFYRRGRAVICKLKNIATSWCGLTQVTTNHVRSSRRRRRHFRSKLQTRKTGQQLPQPARTRCTLRSPLIFATARKILVANPLDPSSSMQCDVCTYSHHTTFP